MIKRYMEEDGSSWIQKISEPSTGNFLLISELTKVEIVATLRRAGKQGGKLTLNEANAAIQDFLFDLNHQYQVIEVNEKVFNQAVVIADKDGLKGADAVQLAAALMADKEWMIYGISPMKIVSADKELNESARSKGFIVENPEDHLTET
jgi:predicted nucleic acid-binding protein